jgi:membrane-associated phospholipid phosphatase
MANTFSENRIYFILMSLFIILGGIYLGQSDKVDAIFFCSDNRTPFLNEAFKIITRFGEAPAYFVIGLGALAVSYRHTLLVAFTGLTVMGLSFSLKAFFAIDRPMAFFAKQNLTDRLNLIEGIEMHTGATSFPSGHTMSAFALYSLLIFLLPKKHIYGAILFLLALLVGFSRIYLAQHFWPDVYAGGIIGAVWAVIIYSVQSYFPVGKVGWLDSSPFAQKR